MSLLVHDGELADLRTLFDELGTPYVERLGGIGPEDREIGWDLVISTPKQMLALNLDTSDCDPVLIAILEQDSRTLRNSLRRAGITLIVRRPVHRAALRALVLHSLYRGPEKRRASRVPIGAPVRFRTGWRQHNAILADLSVSGCRLLTNRALERGTFFKLNVPADVAGRRSFSVKARALQIGRYDGLLPTTLYVTARFENVSARQHDQLRATVARHSHGPATYAGAGSLPSAGVAPRSASEPTRVSSPCGPEPTRVSSPPCGPEPTRVSSPCDPEPTRAEPGPSAALEAAVEETALAPAADAGASELEYEVEVEVDVAMDDANDDGPDPDAADDSRDVANGSAFETAEFTAIAPPAADAREAALDAEATRVLMGHDISVGGMRVEPTETLSIGMDLQLAIHVERRETPLVVRARVHRDEGERGLVLRFHELEAETTHYLNDMLDELPIVDVGDGSPGYLVTEILASA